MICRIRKWQLTYHQDAEAMPAKLARHVESCTSCQAHHRRLQDLDGALASSVDRAAKPATAPSRWLAPMLITGAASAAVLVVLVLSSTTNLGVAALAPASLTATPSSVHGERARASAGTDGGDTLPNLELLGLAARVDLAVQDDPLTAELAALESDSRRGLRRLTIAVMGD